MQIFYHLLLISTLMNSYFLLTMENSLTSFDVTFFKKIAPLDKDIHQKVSKLGDSSLLYMEGYFLRVDHPEIVNEYNKRQKDQQYKYYLSKLYAGTKLIPIGKLGNCSIRFDERMYIKGIVQYNSTHKAQLLAILNALKITAILDNDKLSSH